MAGNDEYSIKTLCSSCTHQSCCTGFDSAIVFPEDLATLEKIGKANSESLEDAVIAGEHVKQIRKNQSQHCIFWDGKCSIYDFRPLDCRLFPFDIDMINGEFYWIVYSCNKDSDWKWTEDHLQRFERDPTLYKKTEYLKILAVDGLFMDLEKMPFTVLRKVTFT